VGVDAGDDVEVAVLAGGGLLAATFEADARAIADAGGDFDFDDLAFSVAIDLQRKHGAAGGLGEGELGDVLDIGAALGFGARARAGAATCAGAGSSSASAEELVEDGGEIAARAAFAEVEIFDGNVGAGLPLSGAGAASAGLGAAEGFPGVAASARLSAADAGVAELVVIGALGGVGEDVVGFLDFLELFLGGFVVLVDVGVVLTDELAVRLAEFVGAGVARDAEDFVIVSFGHVWIES